MLERVLPPTLSVGFAAAGYPPKAKGLFTTAWSLGDGGNCRGANELLSAGPRVGGTLLLSGVALEALPSEGKRRGSTTKGSSCSSNGGFACSCSAPLDLDPKGVEDTAPTFRRIRVGDMLKGTSASRRKSLASWTIESGVVTRLSIASAPGVTVVGT